MTRLGSLGQSGPSRPSEDRLTIRKLEEEIARLRTGTVCALNEMLDFHDLDTSLHASRLAEWAVRVGLDMRETKNHFRPCLPKGRPHRRGDPEIAH